MIENIFSTPIWTYDFTGEEFEKIQEEIGQAIDKIRAQASPAPWDDNLLTTFNNRRNEDIEQFLLTNLALGLGRNTGQFLESLDYQGLDLRIKQSWVNFMGKNSQITDHVHPDSRVSGVYYYAANPKSAPLEFKHPVGQLSMGMWPYDNEIMPLYSIDPKPGRLVLWPSWLVHRVAPNVSDQERISFNFTLV